MKGKIPPGDSRSILFSFMCKDEMPDPGEKQILINIRGGTPIVLDFYAKTSIPKVSIIQADFNFGDIRFGNTGTLPMTIINEGNIDADLILDLREKEGVKELEGVEGLSI